MVLTFSVDRRDVSQKMASLTIVALSGGIPGALHPWIVHWHEPILDGPRERLGQRWDRKDHRSAGSAVDAVSAERTLARVHGARAAVVTFAITGPNARVGAHGCRTAALIARDRAE